jgi:hypothetical protein
MTDVSPRKPSNVRKAVLAIAAGGLIAGMLDLGQALIFIWSQDSPGDRCWLAGAAGFPWRRGDIHFGCTSALFDRSLSGGHLFRSKSQIAILNRIPSSLRLVLRRSGRTCDAPDCSPAFCASRKWALPVS